MCDVGLLSGEGMMTINERLVALVLLGILLPVLGWLLSTVAINSGRLSVLEVRHTYHEQIAERLEKAVEAHRASTEH